MNLSVFFVFIMVNDVYVTDIGPFVDYSSCLNLEQTIKVDITKSMKIDFPYGMSTDKWGIGNGAIYRINDYDIECKQMTIPLE